MSGTNHIKPVKKPRAKKVIDLNKNRLTFDDIAEDDKKYDELVTITFDDGRFTEIYKCFRPTRIDDMLDDYSVFINDYIKYAGDITEKQSAFWLEIYKVIYFSTMVDVIPDKFEQKLNIIQKMADSNAAEKVSESFDKAESDKVTDILAKKFNSMIKLMENNIEVKKEFKKQMKALNLNNFDIINEGLFGGELDDEDVEEESVENTEVESGDLIG